MDSVVCVATAMPSGPMLMATGVAGVASAASLPPQALTEMSTATAAKPAARNERDDIGTIPRKAGVWGFWVNSISGSLL